MEQQLFRTVTWPLAGVEQRARVPARLAEDLEGILRGPLGPPGGPTLAVRYFTHEVVGRTEESPGELAHEEHRAELPREAALRFAHLLDSYVPDDDAAASLHEEVLEGLSAEELAIVCPRG